MLQLNTNKMQTHIVLDVVIILQVRNSSKTPLVSVIVTGAPGSGKTALATKIACDSGFPFVKICSPSDLVGYSEAAKCQHLKKVSLFLC